MEQMVGKILKTYGTAVTLCRGEEMLAVKALIQPVRSKSWDNTDSEYSPLGEIPRGRYVYIGPVEPKAESGDTLLLGNQKYLVRRAELIHGPNGPVYCWGLCLEKGGEDNWGR